MIKFITNWLDEKIPETAQFVIGIIFLIVAPALMIYSFAYFEWVASILFLLIAIVISQTALKNRITGNIRYTAVFIIGFSLAGMIFDAAGNPIYNLPIQKLCPSETELIREVKIVEAQSHDENDAYIQEFKCFSKTENQIVEVIARWQILGIRFLEYFLLSVSFLGIFWVLSKFQHSKKV